MSAPALRLADTPGSADPYSPSRPDPTPRPGSVPTSSELRAVRGQGLRWEIVAELAGELLDRPQTRLNEWVARGQAKVVKTGSHRSVYRLQFRSGTYYLKQCQPATGAAQWMSWLRGTKAAREAARIGQLRRHHLPTPEVVAVGRPLGWGDAEPSYLCTRSLEPAVSLRDAIAKYFQKMRTRGIGCRARQHLIAAVARTVARFHKAGFVHRDLQAENMLVAPLQEHGPVRLWWVDLVDVRRPVLGPRERDVVGNIAMLNHSLVNILSTADRCRFLLSYAEEYRATTIDKKDLAAAETAGLPLAARVSRGRLKAIAWPWRGKVAGAVTRIAAACQKHSEQAWEKADRKWSRGNRRLLIVRENGCEARAVAGLGEETLREICRAPEVMFSPPHLVQTESFSPLIRSAVIQLVVGNGITGARAERRPRLPREEDSQRWGRRYWENAYALMRRGICTPGPYFFVETPEHDYLVTSYHKNQVSLAEWWNENGRDWLAGRAPTEPPVVEQWADTVATLLQFDFEPDSLCPDRWILLTTDSGACRVGVADPSRLGRRKIAKPAGLVRLCLELKAEVERVGDLRSSLALRCLKKVLAHRPDLSWKAVWRECAAKLKARHQELQLQKAA